MSVAASREFKRPLLDAETRPRAQVVEHYEIEVKLAERLKNAADSERHDLYSVVYDELFERVTHHPQLTQKESPEMRNERADGQLQFLNRFLEASDRMLEIGAGDCALSIAAGSHCAEVVAVDVSEVVSGQDGWPANVEFRLTQGTDIPAEDASIDVAYSDQLMEHLHEADAEAQLRNIYRALRSGGRYVCITPNQVAGPWDISVYFDEQARGLHLKEYRLGELVSLMKQAGFDRVDCYAGGRGSYFKVPQWFVGLAENLLLTLPYGIRSRIARTLPVRGLLGMRVVAWKR